MTGVQPTLNVLTCGSVDNGKSTLIGRLLYDAGLLCTDEIEALAAESRRSGTTADGLDLSLLLDGLQAEREQKITIDVAYRYFVTARRRFVIADAPGHAQYTRNMATGASVSDLALVLIDVRKGVTVQTRRHSVICKLLGIRHVVLIVNKMDLVGFEQESFEAVTRDYRAFAAIVGIEHVACIPVSALLGDNIVNASRRTSWFVGTPLLAYLEEVDVTREEIGRTFRLPVQWVCRPNLDFRGYAGTVRHGPLKVGDKALVLPSRIATRVARIVTADGDLNEAEAGQAVVVTLADEVDVSRGDVIASADAPPEVADQVAAHVISLSDAPLLPGRAYQALGGPQTMNCSITAIKHRLNVDNLDKLSARSLAPNEIGNCNLAFSKPFVFDPYVACRETGSLVLVDKTTHQTVAAVTVEFGLRRSENRRWQDFDIDRRRRAELKHQKPFCLWFTGLSGAGKSTLANLLEKRLAALACHTYVLDGDNVRHGLNADLGFTDTDRVENIRRVAEVSRLMVDAGLIVIVSFISPFRAERQMARNLFATGEFLEVFVDTPLQICEARDPKGLYRKARAGQLKNFTGIDSPYEPPKDAEMRLDGKVEAEELIQQLIDELAKRTLL